MSEMNYEVQHVPVRQIVPGDNDRKEFDPDRLAELAASIDKDGLSNPITVAVVGFICLSCNFSRLANTGVPDSCPHCGAAETAVLHRISAGERRFRAISQILKWETAPAFVRQMDRETEAAIMLHENVNRVNLNPMEEAEAYQARADEFGWDDAEIASRAGTTEKNVRQKRSLLGLVPVAQDLVRGELMPLGHAYALIGMPDSIQQEAVKLLGRVSVPYAKFKQFLTKLEEAAIEQSAFDFTSFWIEQAEEDAARQKKLRARSADLVTRDGLPEVRGDRKDTAGDIILRYMNDLADAGYEEEAGVVGNLLHKLLSLRKAKNFRTNPKFDT